MDHETRSAEEMPQQLVITSAGNLQISGHLSTIQPAPSYVRDEDIADTLKLDHLRYLTQRFRSTSYGFHPLTQDLDGGYDKAVLGIARFDSSRTMSYNYACFLGTQTYGSQEMGQQEDQFVARKTIVSSHWAAVAR